jgi:hypothetical protein
MGHTESGILSGKIASNQTLVERYTEATRRALNFARLEACHRGDTAITVADLLAGLSFDEGTRAERVGSLKVNAFYLRWLSGLPALPVQICLEDGAQPDFDLEAKRALVFAVMEADRDREYWIDSDHLLRGLLRFPNKAHFAVLKTEVNLNSARIASRRDRAEFLPEETPNLKVVKYLLGKHLALWLPPLVSLACYIYILLQSFGPQLAPLTK